MKTVIFGGSFNPIHIGHVSVINEAIKALEPDRFILMPAHIPPHKEARDLAGDTDRLNMCRLAVSDIPGVEVSDYELTVDEKSYTVNTLEHFHSIYPEDELSFLMGSDMLISFLKWYKADRILGLATLVCISRKKDDKKAINKAREEIEAVGGRVIIIDCDPVEVSSTDIRARIAAYSSAGGLVPKEVEKYILENHLYIFDKSKYNSYVEFLAARLSNKRFVHSVNVANEAVRLAKLNNCDLDKAYFAGLMHDTCKEIPYDEQLALVKRSAFPVTDVELGAKKTWHGIAASVFLAEEFGIEDEEVLSAIRYHTVAKGGMTTLEKIVYMADLISAERDFDDVDRIREVTYNDLNMGMYEALKFTVEYSCSHVRTIPHITLDAYNEYTTYKLKNGY